MSYPTNLSRCPKCDFERDSENRTCTLQVDVAHSMQSVDQGLAEAESALNRAAAEKYGKLCLVVGGGRIRDQVEPLLKWKRQQGEIRRFRQPANNPGCFLIDLPNRMMD